jgi:polyribonucleotide nucleotidyltransferase
MSDGRLITATVPFGETDLTLESGKLARQAGGAVVVRHGDTVLLVAATIAPEPREGVDFFPMTIDYEERMYAAGKISSSKFMKREGRPSEEAILKSRIVDRSIRPMFPKGFRREVQVIITTLAYDETHDAATLAVIGASAALLHTDAPFEGPIAAVRDCRVGCKFKWRRVQLNGKWNVGFWSIRELHNDEWILRNNGPELSTRQSRCCC